LVPALQRVHVKVTRRGKKKVIDLLRKKYVKRYLCLREETSTRLNERGEKRKKGPG